MVVPTPIEKVRGDSFNVSPIFDETSFVIEGHSPGSPLERPYHWLFAGASATTFARAFGASERLGTQVVNGVTLTIRYDDRVEAGMNEGHVIVDWRQDGQAYLVSVHNRSDRDEAIRLARGWLQQISEKRRG